MKSLVPYHHNGRFSSEETIDGKSQAIYEWLAAGQLRMIQPAQNCWDINSAVVPLPPAALW